MKALSNLAILNFPPIRLPIYQRQEHGTASPSHLPNLNGGPPGHPAPDERDGQKRPRGVLVCQAGGVP